MAPSRPAALRRSLGAAVAVASVIVVVGLAIALFFNPIWVFFAQDRAGVPAITGYAPEQVRRVTGAILHDVLVGPPDFLVSIDGLPVLGTAERSHMVDVYAVVRWAMIVATIALAILVAVFATNRGQAWTWRAVATGSGALVAIGAVIGVAVVFFFDAAFLLFHRVFFAQGNFAFDPGTQRLVQLLPDQFWTESVTAVALVGLAIAVVVRVIAGRRAASAKRG